MKEFSKFVGLDVHKESVAVSVAESASWNTSAWRLGARFQLGCISSGIGDHAGSSARAYLINGCSANTTYKFGTHIKQPEFGVELPVMVVAATGR